MRLVFTVTNDLSYDQRMQRIAGTLSAAGYAVTLVGFEKPHSIPLRDAPYRQIRLRPRFTRGKLFYLEYNHLLYHYLLREKPDLIGSIDLDTLSAGYRASRKLDVPLVFDAHEYFSELPEVVSRPLIHRFWSGLENFLCRKVEYNYTVSHTIAQAMGARYGRSYTVFPNLPRRHQSSGQEPEGYKKTQPFVLYQGALNQGRGLEQAIDAFASLPLELHIAGEGDLSAALRQRAEQSVSRDNIRFLGYLEPEHLRTYTPGAWLGLNLLENRGLSYYYSLSNKFFDYLHAGVPQICMDFPEYRRINAEIEVAVLLPELNPEKLATAVRDLQSDPVRYERLRSNCLLARERYCWEAIEPEIVRFYSRIVPPTSSDMGHNAGQGNEPPSTWKSPTLRD